MEIIKLLVCERNRQNICFMCFKQNENYHNVDDNMEINDENSINTTTLRNISNFLFPFYDIISDEACEICTKLIIEMYTTINRGLMKIKLIQKMTERLNRELESKSIMAGNKITVNLIKDIKMTKEHFENHGNVAEQIISTGDICRKSLEKGTSMKTHLKYPTEAQHKKIIKEKSHARKPTKISANYIYKCNDCDYKTSNKQDLESHMNKTHLNVRPFICKSCQKAFYSLKNLKEHCLIHEISKNMVCDVCGERFSYKKTLKIHMSSHVNQKPYNCDTCGHKFVTNSQRNEHIKRKHGPKGFSCHLCDKKYSLRKSLRRHKKNIHDAH